LLGTAADADYSNLMQISGLGSLNANFATGAINLDGSIHYREDLTASGRARVELDGSFTGTASLSSSSNAFTGTLSFVGIGPYSGSINGRFYGPAADEVGTAFGASDGTGGVLTGALVGGRKAATSASGQTLPNLTSATAFTPLVAANLDSYRVERALKGLSLAYSPTTQIYQFRSPFGGNIDADSQAIFTDFGPANVVAGAAPFTSYSVTATDRTLSARLFKPGPDNAVLALTYASFADITVNQISIPGNASLSNYVQHYYLPFGLQTPAASMPTSGSASYAGVAYGDAYATASGVGLGLTPPTPTPFSGTSTLTANFASATFTTTLDLGPVGGGSAFGSFTLNGSLSGNQIYGFARPGGGQATFIEGNFFGPAANEFGAVFSTFNDTPGGRTTVIGVTGGKKN
jgi:hypothetical protein